MSKPPNTYGGVRQGSMRDKTSYGIVPTSPSPTESSSGLAQSGSNSASNSSSSPPEPTTPPQRLRRYPDLGRVPLHRRGTSKTYERLEDLLKEAGYKETRIFTPETERAADAKEGSEDSRQSVVRDGMDAVVGFFTGLLPASKPYTTSPQDYSPPASPLAQRYPRRSLDTTEPPTPTNLTSSIDSIGGPTPKAVRSAMGPPSSNTTHPAYPNQLHRELSFHSIQKQPSRSSMHRSGLPNPNSNIPPHLIASPRPSRAGAYLRHMASVPSIPQRPSSTPVRQVDLNESDSEASSTRYQHLRRRLGAAEGPAVDPPLPPTWLETVARAVLFGGTGAHIGGPSTRDHPAAVSSSSSSTTVRPQVLRTTRSSLSQVSRATRTTAGRSGLSSTSGFLVPPPPLFTQIERGRAGRSEGAVSLTRVVCRSAPGSRSGSAVRDAADATRKDRWRGGAGLVIASRKERGRSRRNLNDPDVNRVPSLAKTHAEGDVLWSSPSAKARARRKARRKDANRYLGGWGADADVESAGSGSEATGSGSSDGPDYDYDEEEDEGELDLARILVPPKRQNSIKSLRKHLALDTSAGPPSSSGAHATLKNLAGGIRVISRPVSRASLSRTALASGSSGGTGSGSSASKTNAASGGRSSGTSTPSLLRRATSSSNDWDGESQEEWGGGWVRGSGRGSRDDDDDVDSFVGFFGEGKANGPGSTWGKNGKSRLGFSTPWGGGS